MRKTYAERRKDHIVWKMRVEENIKSIYKYDRQCIEFLEKYDIAEKGFK